MFRPIISTLIILLSYKFSILKMTKYHNDREIIRIIDFISVLSVDELKIA